MKCNLCEGTDFAQHTNTACYLTQAEINAVKCKNCGLVFLNPKPDKSLGLDYFEKAYSNESGFHDNSYYRNHDQIIERNQKRLMLLNELNVKNRNILDFGAGAGHFVKVANDNNWKAIGVEQSPSAINSAHKMFGIDLLISTNNLPKKSFGIITLWDVIEHLEKPKEVLLILSELLDEDGYFVIETSNIDSYDYLINKKKWSYWHVDHFYYFSYITLNKLFKNIGFQEVKVKNPIIKGSINTSARTNKLAKLFKHKNIGVYLKLAYYYLAKKNIMKSSLMTIVYKKI